MALSERKLWSLDHREYDALVRVKEEEREFQTRLVAELRADVLNTGYRDYGRVFEAADLMPGAKAALEDKVAELIAGGMSPAAAAAVASSKRPKDQQIRAIDSIQPKRPAADGKRSRRA